jgi:hypothetical protein
MPFNVGGTIVKNLDVKYYNNKNIVTSGLQIYLDSNLPSSYPGSGSTWYDISGNGRNFTWVSSPSFSTERGMNYFSTSGNRATGPASNSIGINDSSGYTVIMISQTNTDNANSAFKFYGSPNGRGIFMHPGWSNYTIYFDQGGCCNADQRLTYTGGVNDFRRYRMWTVSSTVTQRKIYMNGTLVSSTSTTAANIGLTTTAIDLGSSDEYGGNSSTWNGKLNTFLVYNRGLSDTEVLQNYQFFRTRYEKYFDCGYGCQQYDYDPGCTVC